MEMFLKKYGVILLMYAVIICGILLLNERIRLLNQNSNVIYEVENNFSN